MQQKESKFLKYQENCEGVCVEIGFCFLARQLTSVDSSVNRALDSIVFSRFVSLIE